MLRKKSWKSILFDVINYTVLIAAALSCLLPIVHLFATSLSQKHFIEGGMVAFIPRGFNLDAYKIVFQTEEFFVATLVSLKRVVISVPLTLIVSFLMAYPLSKSSKQFKGRAFYIVLVVIPMFLNSGFMPFYIWMKQLKLFDSIWALVLPGLLNTGNVVLLMNFIRMLPKDIEEAAYVDGADYFTSMIRISIPLCLPIIATLTLFSFVSHWNSWFDGLVYNNNLINYPLQTYLKNIVDNVRPSSMESATIAMNLSNEQINAAQIFIAIIPIMAVYPFLQKYFVKGIVVGAVKG